MKLKLLLVLSLTIISCSILKNEKNLERVPSSNENKAEEISTFQGLDSIDLGKIQNWTKGLNKAELTSSNEKNSIVNSVVEAFQNSNDVKKLFDEILKLNLHKSYKKEREYIELAEGILAARKKIRLNLVSSPQYTKESMLLLELLAEEALYVQSVKFNQKKLVKFEYNNIVDCEKSSFLDKTKVCQGDILISKGEAGSSSFISRTTDVPGNASHAGIVVVDENKKSFVLESFIQDGTKLRDPKDEYVGNYKTKLTIYRSKNREVVLSGVEGVDLMMEEINQILNGKDIKKYSPFDYDFSMNAEDEKKVFCSELVYRIYNKSNYIKNNSELNPYSKKIWSKVTDPNMNLLLSKYLGAKTTFPSPSDIELNPNFEVISTQYNPKKFSGDRIRDALIDALISEIKNNESSFQNGISKIDGIGTKIVDPDEIEKIFKSFEHIGYKFPADFYEKIHSIPENINYKQMLFFALIDSKLTPESMKEMQALEKSLLKEGEILDLKTLRFHLKNKVHKEIIKFSGLISMIMKTTKEIKNPCDISGFLKN